MKALSIKKPCVQEILHEGKDIENRSWKRSFLSKLPLGAICGVARVVDIVTKSRSKWFEKPTRIYPNFGWVFVDVRRLKRPIPCKGMLGLWNIPPSVLRSMKRQLPKRAFSKT